MRIEELSLQAYGAFTDRVLDLGGHGLQVVYGPNEAGKSTTLRAVRSLLYGIAARTNDSFLHDNTRLRVGGRLVASDGRVLELVRRKGNKNTLLTPTGAALDESALDGFLGGLPEALFDALFGIGHDELVRGGREILQGRGEVGQSLFSAGLGGSHLRRVLADLEREADELFRPRGQNQRINQAVGAYETLRKEVRDLSVRGRDFEDRHKALQEALTQFEHVKTDLERAHADAARLERLRLALPHAAERREVLASLLELQDAARLRAGFAAERQEAAVQLDGARRQLAQGAQERQELQAQLAALVVPRDLLAEAATVARLHGALAARREDAGRRADLEAARATALRLAQTVLREVRPDLTMDGAEALRPLLGRRPRLQELASRKAGLDERLEGARRQAAEAEAAQARASRDLAERPEVADPADLAAVAKAVRGQGDLEAELGKRQRELRAAQESARVELGRLHGWTGTLEELEAAPAPLAATVDGYEARFTALEDARKGLTQAATTVARELQELESALDGLLRGVTVPTEADLAASRDLRDRTWSELRRGWQEPVADRFEGEVAEADALADRLRREADRVARQAELAGQRERALARQAETRAAQAELLAQSESLQAEWQALWPGLEARSPREMRAWLASRERLLEKAETLRAMRVTVAALEDALTRCRAELQRVGIEGAAESVAMLLARAERTVEERTRLRAERADLARRAAEWAETRERSLRAAEAAEARLAEWQREWAAEDLDVPPSEAPALLDRLARVLAEKDRHAALGEDLATIDRAALRFADEVRALAGLVAPELAAEPAERALLEIHRRLADAQRDETRLAELRKRLAGVDARLEEGVREAGRAEARLRELCREAGVASPDDLPAAERRSAERVALETRLLQCEGQLRDLGAGASVDEVVAQASALDPDLVPGMVQACQERARELQARRDELQARIGELTSDLRRMDGSGGAAEAAEKAQQVAAGLREDVNRYVRLRLAHAVLRREIERFRQENQGPLLGMACDLFARLTCGSFASLRTDFNDKDEPVLVGVAADGRSVPVEGMSDGTRDQLYLALRLAHLHRFLDAHEPMPFVVDDILIQFDDERAAATLEVLAELGRRAQVLYFTHLRRDVELARDLPEARIVQL